jgi:hypothetical protein
MNIRNLRILFVHSGSDLYGASRSLLRLTSRLVQDGATVKAVLPNHGPLVSALQEKGATVIIQNSLPIIERQKVRSFVGVIQLLADVFLSFISLLKLLRQFKPHLVHTMTAGFYLRTAAKFMGLIWHVAKSFSEFGMLWRYYQKYMLCYLQELFAYPLLLPQFEPNKAQKRFMSFIMDFQSANFPASQIV